MSGVDVRVVTTLSELESLRQEWDVLSAPFGMPLLDHDWFLSAAESLHAEQDLRVVTVRENGRLTAAAPMAFNRAERHLVLLGTAALYEPSGWLFSSESALHHLANAILDIGEVAVLDRVPAGSPLCGLLPRLLRRHAVTIARQAAPSFAVRIERPWNVMSTQWSSRTRRTLEAARVRAEREVGEVRIERLRPRAADVTDAFAALVAVEAGGWKGRAGSALALRPELWQFFDRYARRAAGPGRLCVTVLRMGGAVAAVELAVDAYGRHWGLKLAYDENFAHYSPALLLVHASIQAATEDGLTAVEFLGSAESWQERWKPERREYTLAAVYPFTRRSMMTAVRDAASHLSRRVHNPLSIEAATA